MYNARDVASLRQQVREWRARGESIGFVPTMGNLHAGHLALVERARAEADRVVVSIFVNPTQFGPDEDYARYPRTEAEDAAHLDAAGADLLFLPDVAEMYPGGTAATTFVEVPGISDEFCGAFRPGHFRGVATVVARLFNMVQPDVAVFGEKDFQQLMVVRRIVHDLAWPIRIVGLPTVREPDGLAMSSRNRYLDANERNKAAFINRLLHETGARLADAGERIETLEQQGIHALEAKGFRPDYFAIRRTSDLGMVDAGDHELVILVAAHLGKTRLIDNLRVERD